MLFGDFKNNIEKVFDELSKLVNKTDDILTQGDGNTILKGRCNEENWKRIKSIEKDLVCHLEKILRKQMKCVFFGQTSNGKSATINAILGQEVLPSCDGRTTSCFITIDGCDEDAYFMVGNTKERNIEKLIEKANELCLKHKHIDTKIELFWPKDKCNLLKDHVQLLDSPGVDFSDNNDRWIETYCLDSDLFVYVVNAQSTINESERKFFRKVNSLIKNPNIIVVMNKWDLCDIPKNQNKIEKIKQQHIETVDDFLCKDLKLKCYARDKTFFLSAKEELEDYDSMSIQQNNGDQKRLERKNNFAKFFKMLCEQMSKYAIVNKFLPHLDSCDEYLKDIIKVLEPFENFEKQKVNSSEDDLLQKVNTYIEDIFGKIKKDGESMVIGMCPEFANCIIRDRQDGMAITSFVQEKIMDSLQEIFVKNISKLSKQIKKLLLSTCEFQLTDDKLSQYIPPSFDANADKLKRGLSVDMETREAAARNEFQAANDAMNQVTPIRQFFDTARSLAGSVAIPIMLKFPVAGIVTASIFAGIDAYNKNTDQTNKTEMIKQVKRKAQEVLLEQMNDFYKKCEKDIKGQMKGLIKTFRDDLNDARKIIIQMDSIRFDCEDISKIAQIERAKIMSIEY